MRPLKTSFLMALAVLVVPGTIMAQANPWQPGPVMNSGRYGFPLVELPSGNWLAAGGVSGSGFGAGAEVLDGGATAWNTVSDRAPSNAATSGCELYDPSSGTWSAAGSLNESRSQHTATLLPEVLVAGGAVGPGTSAPLTTAEIYDPTSGSWSATGAMATPRIHHSAALLPDGRVVVAGGLSTGAMLSSTEIFDPALVPVELMSFSIE